MYIYDMANIFDDERIRTLISSMEYNLAVGYLNNISVSYFHF